jgi:hypothetical protein
LTLIGALSSPSSSFALCPDFSPSGRNWGMFASATRHDGSADATETRRKQAGWVLGNSKECLGVQPHAIAPARRVYSRHLLNIPSFYYSPSIPGLWLQNQPLAKSILLHCTRNNRGTSCPGSCLFSTPHHTRVHQSRAHFEV